MTDGIAPGMRGLARQPFPKTLRSSLVACLALLCVVVALSGCRWSSGGGGGGTATPGVMPAPPPSTDPSPPSGPSPTPDPPPSSQRLALPGGNALAAGQEFDLAPGETEILHMEGVSISCPAGGERCVLVVQDSGTAFYTGGMPVLTRLSVSLSGAHGLPEGRWEIQPGRVGTYKGQVNGLVSKSGLECPAGGPACVVRISGNRAEYTGNRPVFHAWTSRLLADAYGREETAFAQLGEIGAPVAGSVTQSSGPNSAEVTIQVTPSASGGVGQETAEFSVAGAFGNFDSPSHNHGHLHPATLGTESSDTAADRSIGGIWTHGVGLSRRLRAHTTIHVDLYSDFEVNLTEVVAINEATFDPLSAEWGDGSIGGTVVDLRPGQTISYAADDEVSGTYNGDPGVFVCTGGPCTIFLTSPDDVGDPELIVTGTFNFDPDQDEKTVAVVDTDWLAVGVWLVAPDNFDANHEFGAFADGGDPFTQENIAALEGAATYNGQAVGLYAQEGEVGRFTADASLEANFGDAASLGTVSGAISAFRKEGAAENESWSVSLESTAIGDAHSGFFQGDVSGAGGGGALEGGYGGQFYGNGEAATDQPGSVAGTFNAAGDALRLTGAFGAYR